MRHSAQHSQCFHSTSMNAIVLHTSKILYFDLMLNTIAWRWLVDEHEQNAEQEKEQEQGKEEEEGKNHLYCIHRCTVQLTCGKYSHITSFHVQWMNGIVVVGDGAFYMCKTFLAVILLLFTRLSSCCCCCCCGECKRQTRMHLCVEGTVYTI